MRAYLCLSLFIWKIHLNWNEKVTAKLNQPSTENRINLNKCIFFLLLLQLFDVILFNLIENQHHCFENHRLLIKNTIAHLVPILMNLNSIRWPKFTKLVTKLRINHRAWDNPDMTHVIPTQLLACILKVERFSVSKTS